MQMQRVTMTLLLTGVLGSGCVSAGTHKAKLDELQQALADLAKSRQEAVDRSKERDELQKRIQDALAQVADLSGRLRAAESKTKGLTTERDQYARLLNDSTALVGQLKERLKSWAKRRQADHRARTAAGRPDRCQGTT
jgi:chromosome segregation ATPase